MHFRSGLIVFHPWNVYLEGAIECTECYLKVRKFSADFRTRSDFSVAKNRELLIPEKESCEFWWGFHEKFPTVRVNRIFLCEIFFLCVWQVEALTNGYWSKIWSDRYFGINKSHAFTQFFTQILRRGISFYISLLMSICLHHIDLSRDSMTRT